MRILLGLLGVIGLPPLALWRVGRCLARFCRLRGACAAGHAVERAGQGLALARSRAEARHLPAPGGGKDLPVVVLVYGGAWKDGNRAPMNLPPRAGRSRRRGGVIDYRPRA